MALVILLKTHSEGAQAGVLTNHTVLPYGHPFVNHHIRVNYRSLTNAHICTDECAVEHSNALLAMISSIIPPVDDRYMHLIQQAYEGHSRCQPVRKEMYHMRFQYALAFELTVYCISENHHALLDQFVMRC